MKPAFRALTFAVTMPATCASGIAAAQTTLTIAMVNNGDVIRMQRLADDFTSMS